MAEWPPTITDCECDQPGFCERHNCIKGYWQHRLCRRVVSVFQAFERGEGPCLPIDPESSDSPDSAMSGPGLLQRGMNFARAAMRHAADGLEAVSEEQVEARLEVCHGCEFCDTDRMVCLRPECGCFLKVKAKWRSEQCPLDKWPDISSETEA